MSTFEIAILTVLKNEGGFVENSNDSGGPTNFGISLVWLRLMGFNVNVDYVKHMTQETAIAIYKKYWWDRQSYFRITDQSIATKLFDLAVNEGTSQAFKLIQRACWSVNGYRSLIDDGVLGEVSLTAINNAQPALILASLRSEAAGFYRSLVSERPKYEEFINDWLRRAYS